MKYLMVTILFVLSYVTCLGAKNRHISHLTLIRGGKSKPSKQVSSSKSKNIKSSRRHDDDDDDDYEIENDFEDDEPKPNKRQSASSKPASKGKLGRSSNNRMQLVSVKGKKKPKKSSTFGAFQFNLNLNLKEKLDELAKQGQSVYKDVYRRAKVLRSSPFEGMLLRATWPGVDAVPPEILNEIIRHSIPAFKYGSSSSMEDDPYHMTLHKLWTKMIEKDWRVVMKSSFILHCISRDSSVDTCEKFTSAIKAMSKVKNSKKKSHKYFDIKFMTALDPTSKPYQPIVSSYASYVMYRVKTFSARFEELKLTEGQPAPTLKETVSNLKKAKQAIKYGVITQKYLLQLYSTYFQFTMILPHVSALGKLYTVSLECKVANKLYVKPVVGQAVKMVAMDLRELWKFYGVHLDTLLAYNTSVALASTGEEVTGLAPSAHTLEKEIADLLSFYKITEAEVNEFLQKSSKAFTKLKIKIPTDLLTNDVDMDKLDSQISRLTSITGGQIQTVVGHTDVLHKDLTDGRSMIHMSSDQYASLMRRVSASIDDGDDDDTNDEGNSDEDEEDDEDDTDEDSSDEEDDSETEDGEISKSDNDDDDGDDDVDDSNDTSPEKGGQDNPSDTDEEPLNTDEGDDESSDEIIDDEDGEEGDDSPRVDGESEGDKDDSNDDDSGDDDEEETDDDNDEAGENSISSRDSEDDSNDSAGDDSEEDDEDD